MIAGRKSRRNLTVEDRRKLHLADREFGEAMEIILSLDDKDLSNELYNRFFDPRMMIKRLI